MKFFRSFLLLCLISFSSKAIYAQEIELGGCIMGSIYSGDLRQDYTLAPDFSSYLNYMTKNISYGGGLMLKKNFNYKSSLRLGLNYFRLAGDDKISMPGDNGKAKLNRNLNFFSNNLEFNALYDYNFRSFGWDRYLHSFTPYVFGGLALFHFNPKTTYKGKTYELQPLGTEGQGLIAYPSKNKYSLTQVAIPIGGGLRFALGANYRLDLEFGYRFTFTDYLDDVSGTYADNDVLKANNGAISAALGDRRTEVNPLNPLAKEGTLRGNPKRNDAYMFISINFRYVLFNNACPAFK